MVLTGRVMQFEPLVFGQDCPYGKEAWPGERSLGDNLTITSKKEPESWSAHPGEVPSFQGSRSSCVECYSFYF